MAPRFRLPFRSRRRIEAEIAAEFGYHIERRADELTASGLSPADARAQAEREFGDARDAESYCRGEDLARERAVRRAGWLEDAAVDLRHALRQLRLRPAFTAAAALTLALGIGANAAIFAMVDRLVLRPLPYPGAGRLVAVLQTNTDRAEPSPQISYGDFHDMRAELVGGGDGLDGFAVFLQTGLTVTGDGPAERVLGRIVSADYFRLLGARAIAGRLTDTADTDDGFAQAVVVSRGFWMRRFGGDPAAIGRTITLDGQPLTLAGVVDPAGDLAYPGRGTEVYLPLPPEGRVGNRGFYGYYAIARRAAGTTVDQLAARLAVLGARLEQENPGSNAGRSFVTRPLREAILGSTGGTLIALFGAAGFVLLIAAANLTNLLLARHLLREREFAVRAALGASRGRLARQLLIEIQALTAVGAALGVGLAALGLAVVRSIGWPDALTAATLGLDGRVVAFAAALAVVCGAACALGSAYSVGGGHHTLLRTGAGAGTSRGTHRLRQLLVAGETALAFVLLVGAGLMLTTVARALRSDPGFDTQGLVGMRVAPPASRFRSLEDVAQYFDRLADDVRTLPGATRVALTSQAPLSGDRSGTWFVREDRPPAAGTAPPTVNYQTVAPGFFATLGIPLVRGRDFTPADRGQRPHRVIVTEELARTLYAGEDPIGKRVFLGPAADDDPHEIIGVVRSVRHFGLTSGPLVGVYDLFGQHGGRSAIVIVRSSLPAASILQAVRARVAAFDGDAPTYSATSFEDLGRASVADRRAVLVLLGVFSAVALALAVVGIYGVVAQSVRARWREYGIRMALGAAPQRLQAGVLGGGAGLAGAGVVAGIAGAALLTRVLAGLLYGVAPLDPRTFALVALVLLLAAIGAATGPAWRAGRVNVARVLREE